MTIPGTPPSSPTVAYTAPAAQVPTFAVDQILYLKESAALGFLEAIRIKNITYGRSGWIYAVDFNPRQPTTAPYYGDSIFFQQRATVYFREDEFVTKSQALVIIKAYLELRLEEINSMISELPD